MRTAEINLKPISFMQQDIMCFVHEWVVENKIPVPQSKIINQMIEKGYKKSTVVYGINYLLRQGWIRQAVSQSNRTEYVECRTL